MTVRIFARGAAIAAALAVTVAAFAQPSTTTPPATPTSPAVPAPGTSAPGADPQGVNPVHYQCYRVSPITKLGPKKLTLKDQFTGRSLALGQAVSICAPVSKNNQPVKDERTHLTCYQVPAANAGKKVRVQHQFGTQDLQVGGATILCLPSLKRVL